MGREQKSKIMVEETLFIVFDSNKLALVPYYDRYYKLSFSLAYELYKQDPKNRKIMQYGTTTDGRCIGLKPLTNEELENVDKLLRQQRNEAFGVTYL